MPHGCCIGRHHNVAPSALLIGLLNTQLLIEANNSAWLVDGIEAEVILDGVRTVDGALHSRGDVNPRLSTPLRSIKVSTRRRQQRARL